MPRPFSARAGAAAAGRAAFALLLALVPTAAPALEAADPFDRVQLHRNPNRGVPYLPLAGANELPGKPSLVMKPALQIELDGSPLTNVYANLRPIDIDGDGTFEFVHYNGYRFMQVWSAAGEKLWRIYNADGRLHDPAGGTQRDTISVLDLDGDGTQEIAHCWIVGGERRLVYRRGTNGHVMRSLRIDGGVSQECQIGAFRMEGSGEIQILVSHSIAGAAAKSCPRNWVGYWARAVAFDRFQRKLWDRNTCDAGHYVWPLDENRNGLTDAVFVGKYLLRPDGTERCVLSSWPQDDHVDGMAIADLDPSRPGLETVAVGRTGTAMFEAGTCREIWRIAPTVIRDPQHVAVARLDPASKEPAIVVDERGSVPGARVFVLNGAGQVLAANTNPFMPMQNANLDGAFGIDEMVGSFGRVVDRLGNTRLGRGWYWDLKGNKVRETALGPYPTNYDRWQAFPLVFDHDGDGVDEIVTWGQSLIVVGKIEGAIKPPPPLPAPATDTLYWLRYIASYPDLITGLGADTAKAVTHYQATGHAQGRTPVFEPQPYLARNPWVATGFGSDLEIVTRHYIEIGYAKGFTFLDTHLHWLRYVASHQDLIQRFGTLPSGAELHWLTEGKAAGRTITFDPVAYVNGNPAAKRACTTNLLCATKHFITAATPFPSR